MKCVTTYNILPAALLAFFLSCSQNGRIPKVSLSFVEGTVHQVRAALTGARTVNTIIILRELPRKMNPANIV
ncbi:MAG: hypothetical protein GY754_32750 [bacterium]|nr:hypothetical protein [bacterium]